MGQASFSYTGSTQSWTVPTYVSQLYVDVYGAGGGSGQGGDGDSGGYGGRVRGNVATSSGTTLYVVVGEKGGKADNDTSGGDGGWPGGGNGDQAGKSIDGYTAKTAGGGGGGYSDIRLGSTNLNDSIVVAGGGGGGGGANASGSNNTDNDGSIGGDGNGDDANPADAGGSTVTGAKGDSQSGRSGGGASNSTSSGGDWVSVAAGGGGGGGHNGGAGGDVSTSDSLALASGGGGGGTLVDTNYVSNYSIGTNSTTTDGVVYIDYLKRPTNLSASVNTNGNIALDWNDNSADESGFEVYHANSSGVSTADTLVASLGSNTSAYTDTTDRTGENYYRVRAYKNNVAEWSNETKVVTTTINYNDGSTWPEGVVYYHDGDGWTPASGVYSHDGASWNEST